MKIEKARSKQEELEMKILELLEKFELETNCIVDNIEIERINTTSYDEGRKDYKNFINTIKTKILL